MHWKLRVRLDEGVEKWEDGKLWEDRKVGRWKIFNFPSCVFGLRGGKVEGWKSGRVENSFVWLERKMEG